MTGGEGSPESNRGIPGIKPGNPRNQTGESPESNRALSGIKPGDPRNQTRDPFSGFSSKKTTPAKLSQIWLNLAVPPKRAQFHQKLATAIISQTD